MFGSKAVPEGVPCDAYVLPGVPTLEEVPETAPREEFDPATPAPEADCVPVLPGAVL